MSRRIEAMGRRIASSADGMVRGSRRHLEVLLLVASLVPIVVAVVRAIASGWIPLGDGAYFVARSRDVLTSHHPLVGALSSGSTATDATFNNLGPLHLDLLAPFTKLDPRWGAAVGVGALNAAACVGVWLTSRRLFGLAGVAGVMLATIALELTIGSALLIDARQQVTLLLPLWCLLWLTVALSTGRVWALPWAALVASLLLQTHLSYSFLTAALAVFGSGILAWRLRGRWRTVRAGRWVAATLAVLAVCWAQTIWDQLADSGNFTNAMGSADTEGVGATMGVRIVADSVLVPPFWSPGSLSSFMASDLAHEPRLTFGVGIVVVGVWVAALAGVLLIERRWRDGRLRACAHVSLVAMAAGVLTAIRIPPLPEFGLAPQNYFWLWPLGAFFTVTVAGGVVHAVANVRGDRAADPAARAGGASTGRTPVPVATVGLVVLAVLGGLLGSRARDDWPQAPYGPEFAEVVLDELDDNLDEQPIEGPVVLSFLWGVDEDSLNYTLLTTLQDRGIEFVFPADSPNVVRFGHDRCMSGTEAHQLRILYGEADIEPGGGERLVASVDDFTGAEAEELAALDASFGERLRDGTVGVDVEAARYFGSDVPPEVPEVLETPGAPATGLATVLDAWAPWDIVRVPDDLADDWERWVQLQRRAEVSRVAIVLSPNDVSEPDRTC